MQERILLNRPDLIEQVLVIQQNKFHKSELTKRITGALLGQGLLISEGEFWRRQRRLAQPAFHRGRVNEYATTMIESTEAHVREWRGGEKRDVAAEMMALTMNITVRDVVWHDPCGGSGAGRERDDLSGCVTSWSRRRDLRSKSSGDVADFSKSQSAAGSRLHGFTGVRPDRKQAIHERKRCPARFERTQRSSFDAHGGRR